MSTRANIIIKDNGDKLYFYRHSNGYPEGTLPTLEKLLNLVKDKKIRDNVGQCAGWLILIGAIEYQTLNNDLFPKRNKPSYDRDHKKVAERLEAFMPNDWKCGAYEPTTGLHGDIEHLYVIDLSKKEIVEIPSDKWTEWEAGKG